MPFLASSKYILTFIIILGANDNPSASEFRSIYRKLLVCHQIVYKNDYGNCITDETGVLTVSSKQPPRKPTQNFPENIADDVVFHYDDLTNDNVEKFDQHMNAYMASIVENNIMSTLARNHKAECNICINVFSENNKINDPFIDKKRQTDSKVHQPCESTVTIITVINKISILLSQGNSFDYVLNTVFNHLATEALFDQSDFKHQSENDMAHKEGFIRKIVENYLKMKAEKIGNRISEEERGTYIRHKNKKNVHNAGQ